MKRISNHAFIRAQQRLNMNPRAFRKFVKKAGGNSEYKGVSLIWSGETLSTVYLTIDRMTGSQIEDMLHDRDYKKALRVQARKKYIKTKHRNKKSQMRCRNKGKEWY